MDPFNNFMRPNLDVLFVGLNPATASAERQHYFSTTAHFWNRLYDSGLITRALRCRNFDGYADDLVFGQTTYNAHNWSYGITDLMRTVVETNSQKVKPTTEDCKAFCDSIRIFKPRVVVLMGGKVYDSIIKYCRLSRQVSNEYGNIGRLLAGCDTTFFYVPFPTSRMNKIEMTRLYSLVRLYLEEKLA